MLREDRNNVTPRPMPMPRPMPTPMPRREPVYERPSYEDYDCPEYEYPMMPQYPNNMNPCPYPEHDMYGDREMDLDGMMRRNPALRRCIMNCVDRHHNSCSCRPQPRRQEPCRPEPCYPHNPCRPMPMPRQMPLEPRRRPHREPCFYGMEDYGTDYDAYNIGAGEIDTYDFSESHLENIIADSQVEIEVKDEE